MTAILTAESGDVEKVAEIIEECKNMKIPVLPPDINESYGGFTIIREAGDSKDSGKIRFGLHTIKNLGTDISNAIISEREARGKYKSITDFLERVKHKNLNKKSMDALIKSGSMDAWGDRGVMLYNQEDMLLFNHENLKNGNQASLFETISDKNVPGFKLKDGPNATMNEKLSWEKELLGLYISGHPLDRIKEKLKSKEINIKKIKEELNKDASVTMGGMIEQVKDIITKNNERMAFLKIVDLTGTIEAVVFPSVFKRFNDVIIPEKCVAISGKVSMRGDEKSIIIEALKEI
jgi:DNA polymerase-3 subunit alpha